MGNKVNEGGAGGNILTAENAEQKAATRILNHRWTWMDTDFAGESGDRQAATREDRGWGFRRTEKSKEANEWRMKPLICRFI